MTRRSRQPSSTDPDGKPFLVAVRKRLRWPSLNEWISGVVVFLCCAFVFSQLQPGLLFQDSITNGGDMGAHVWAPKYLVDHLLPNGRLTGWSPDWYAGFPALHFYFPLPMIMVALLDIVLPGNVAFKLVTVSGAVSLPFCVYMFGRLARMPFPVPACLAVFTLPFLFDTGYSILGGNLASTLAGEFSFSVALSFAFLFLGVVARGMDTGKHKALASVLFGATILSHVLPTIFAFVAGTLLVLLRMVRARGAKDGPFDWRAWSRGNIVSSSCAAGALVLFMLYLAEVTFAAEPDYERSGFFIPDAFPEWTLLAAAIAVGVAGLVLAVRRLSFKVDILAPLKWAVPVALTGAALAAWWLLPFVAQSGYMNDMGWEKIGNGTTAGLEIQGTVTTTDPAKPPPPADPQDPDRDGKYSVTHYTDALLDPTHRYMAFAAAAGALMAVFFRRRIGVLFIAIALVSMAAFVLMPQGRLWNARFLPFYYLSLCLLAGLLVGEVGHGIANMVRDLRDEASKRRSVWEDVADGLRITAPLAAVLIVAAMLLPRLPEPGWAQDLQGSVFSPPDVWGDEQTATNFIPSWAKWNYQGYDGKDDSGQYYKSAGAEFDAIMTMLRTTGLQQGCGRVMWEYESDLDRFGTPMALMLSPLYTKGCMGSMEGLYFESTATVPYHFLNQAELSNSPSSPMRDIPYGTLNVATGVTKLQLWGVRYYLAVTPEAQQQAAVDPRLTVVGTTPAEADDSGNQRNWVLYRVADSDLVTPLRNLPNVMTDPRSIQTWRTDANNIANDRPVDHKKHSEREAWLENTLAWYGNEANYDAPLAASGPKNWPRVRTALDPLQFVPVPDPPQVTYIGTGDDHISFRVSEVGKPVLVKISYFPNWKVDGAKGPYRVTPNTMVVVPTSNQVTLKYGYTPVDIGSAAISIGAIAAVGAMVRRPTRLLQWLGKHRPVLRGAGRPHDGGAAR